jgi:DNA-binding response OmpR family regulator
VLDLDLPGGDGVELCRRLRATTDAYVVAVAARLDEDAKLSALAAGADDCVTKPFSQRELVARIRAMLRRPRAPAAASHGGARQVGRVSVDVAAREVRVDDRAVELTRIEFDLIEALSERPRVALSRRQLLERVWGPNWFGDDHVVDVHVSKLRRKLGDDGRSPWLVRTVRGVGYRLDGGVEGP